MFSARGCIMSKDKEVQVWTLHWKTAMLGADSCVRGEEGNGALEVDVNNMMKKLKC